MAEQRILVAGGLGVVGRAIVEHFCALPGFEVVALARRSPNFETAAHFVSVDLRDASACQAQLSAIGPVTHLAYAALHEKPQLVRGWLEADHVQTNASMLENLLDVIESPALEHVTLLQGTKAYGFHAGHPLRTPARERDSRKEHQNFYFRQEDSLRKRQAGKRWTTTILRPQIVCGVAVGSAMNVVATLGAYAAIRKELGLPLTHPGHADAIVELTDARLLARAVEWAASSKAGANATFNVTNGDVIAWRDFWPRLAAFYEMPAGEPAPLSLGEEMGRHTTTWRSIAQREGLHVEDLGELIGLSWQYADFLWANPRIPPRPVLVSNIQIRRAGFADCIDSEDMLLEQLAAMETARLLPAGPARRV